MKISKQYLKQLIMEELGEAINIPSGPHGHYDSGQDKFSPGQGPDPEKALESMLTSLKSAIKYDNKEEAIKLVNAVSSMILQFSKDKYTDNPAYGADSVEKMRKGEI